MKRTLFLLLFFVVFPGLLRAADRSFVGNFKGMYGGLSLAYGSARVSVNGSSFRGFFPLVGGLMGGGQVINSLYLGLEAEVDAMHFDCKRANGHLEKHQAFGGALRIGKVLQDNFLSYLSLGLSRAHYEYRSSSLKTSFDVWSFSPEIGVDAFVTPNFMIRSSVRYERATHISQKTRALYISKKPSTSMVKIGFFYKI
jgi:hypothetical protein